MKNKITYLIILFPIIVYSQEWNVVNCLYKYNYSNDELLGITHTIWVDSVKLLGNDSLFYLNRIVSECETCSNYQYTGIGKYAFYNSPQFLQKEVIKTDSTYIFNNPEKFVLKYLAKVGDCWTFDSLRNIQASVINLYEDEIFSQVDSFKMIVLSSEDTIILSKNYGIVRFDPIYENSEYTLLGIDKMIGESIPDFFDIYNFSVGDIFEYHGMKWMTESETKYFIEKVLVWSKIKASNYISYNVDVKYYERVWAIPPWLWYSPNYSRMENYSTTWNFKNNPEHPTNMYNNQLVISSSYLPYTYINDYEYTRLICMKDSNGQYIKIVGSLDYCDFYNISDTLNCILKRCCCGWTDEHEFRFKSGLGEVFHENSGFEWNSSRELFAYKKQNDTTGVLTPNSLLMVGMNESYLPELSLFPNPANEYIYYNTTGLNIIEKIRIISVDGKQLEPSYDNNKISVKGIKSGIYILIFQTNKGILRKKIIIE